MQIIAFKSQKTSKKMEFFGIAKNFELSSLILDIKSCHKMAVVLKNQLVKKSTFLHIHKRSVQIWGFFKVCKENAKQLPGVIV